MRARTHLHPQCQLPRNTIYASSITHVAWRRLDCCRAWVQDLELEITNTAGSVEQTFSFDAVQDNYTFSVGPCLPGTGGDSCTACPTGTYSAGGDASWPKRGCTRCPGGSTTRAPGAVSESECSGM